MTIRDWLYLVLLVVIIGAGVFSASKIRSWYTASQTVQHQQRTLEVTSGVLTDGARADAARTSRDAGLQQGRDNFTRQYQEDTLNDLETASRADRAVPQRVRDNFRARRIARQRLGCAGSECDSQPADDHPAQREGILR